MPSQLGHHKSRFLVFLLLAKLGSRCFPLNGWVNIFWGKYSTFRMHSSVIASLFSKENLEVENGGTLCGWCLVVRARGPEYGGREFESRSLHLKPEPKLREERGLSGCRKGLNTVPLAQALLSLKPAKNEMVEPQLFNWKLSNLVNPFCLQLLLAFLKLFVNCPLNKF